MWVQEQLRTLPRNLPRKKIIVEPFDPNNPEHRNKNLMFEFLTNEGAFYWDESLKDFLKYPQY